MTLALQWLFVKGYWKCIENFVIFLFFFNSQKGVPELVLKDQKDIALEITVTNSPSNPKNPTKDGDDAHEAKLIATFPDTLTYSAYRELRAFPVSISGDHVGRKKHCVASECVVIWYVLLLQEKQLTCVANQNGSQADCELGNPFKRNSSVGDAFTYCILMF